jgi:hypothetical protein
MHSQLAVLCRSAAGGLGRQLLQDRALIEDVRQVGAEFARREVVAQIGEELVGRHGFLHIVVECIIRVSGTYEKGPKSRRVRDESPSRLGPLQNAMQECGLAGMSPTDSTPFKTSVGSQA